MEILLEGGPSSGARLNIPFSLWLSGFVMVPDPLPDITAEYEAAPWPRTGTFTRYQRQRWTWGDPCSMPVHRWVPDEV